ncbi:aromatic amino acid transaminase [Labrenzia sp. VG12]|uniref:aromatic amino acid transaminase n=1 Tax=Labrenzia sp. VG12 TaxID=2021862 RepID=UPI000B8C1824|nr:aromatic amino acid transaminase [Labrenzia sp. VG12]ASP35225.1 amino acid aminotransferase [Labrenzia sp. VG12]
MFGGVGDYPVDPIMIGADLFAQDPRTDKLNLTVGVYENEQGQTPILTSVKRAERDLIDWQETKAYTALTGDPVYCSLLGKELCGNSAYSDYQFVSAQTAGGAVALRVVADLAAQLPASPTIWLQTPTYGNYVPILTAAGAQWRSVPYYDKSRVQMRFEEMLSGLEAARPGDLFLFQGACHNPTGVDMTDEQFGRLLDHLERLGVVPWIDLAYLGFGKGFEADCEPLRKIVARFEECIVCVTLSKSFGIYRDRAGALFLKSRPETRARLQRAVSAIIRSGSSHAPDHGPAVVRRILQDPDLKALWLWELDEMRLRVAGIRQQIVLLEQERYQRDTLAFLGGQSGMFSLLPLDSDQERALTRDHGIHVVKGGRVNVARLNGATIPKLIEAFHQVVQDRSA